MTVKIPGKQVQELTALIANLFDAVDLLSYRYLLQARQTFVPKPLNRLAVALAMPCALFRLIHQKFDSCKIHLSNEFGP